MSATKLEELVSKSAVSFFDVFTGELQIPAVTYGGIYYMIIVDYNIPSRLERGENSTYYSFAAAYSNPEERDQKFAQIVPYHSETKCFYNQNDVNTIPTITYEPQLGGYITVIVFLAVIAFILTIISISYFCCKFYC